jgi:hypothetical protein
LRAVHTPPDSRQPAHPAVDPPLGRLAHPGAAAEADCRLYATLRTVASSFEFIKDIINYDIKANLFALFNLTVIIINFYWIKSKLLLLLLYILL